MMDVRAELIPFRDQLREYPGIKELMLTVPKNLPPPVSPAWIVYGRHEGRPWGRKEFERYKDAFAYVKPRLKTYHDISITCKRKSFPPPSRLVRIKRGGKPVIVKGQQATKLIPIKPPINHQWCFYCRRFTIFTWFSNHHAFQGDKKYIMDPTARRCCVCGVRDAR